MNRLAIITVIVVLASAVMTSACQEKQDIRVQGDASQEIRLVADSPAVRALISNEESVQEAVLDSWTKNSSPENIQQDLKDVADHPERYSPGRKEFLAAMQQQPAVIIHGQDHFEIVKASGAACTSEPLSSPNFILVRISGGSDKGKEGWLCVDQIDPDYPPNPDREPVKAGPAMEITLCELVTHPGKYSGQTVEVRAIVEQGFEVSLLVDKACSARVWFNTLPVHWDEKEYQRIEEHLHENNQVATIVGRFEHVDRIRQLVGLGFGHLNQWQSQLTLRSFEGMESNR